MTPFRWLLAGLTIASFLVPSAWGEPTGWRGDGSGRYPSASPPLAWDGESGRNVLWKAIVGVSPSTPIVVGGRVIVTAEQEKLVCVDAAGGKVLWSRPCGYQDLPAEVKHPAERPPTSPGCGYSAATPVSDGRWIYASFGSGTVACCDFDGNLRWLRYLDLPQVTQYGRSASPVLGGGKLLVSMSGLAALDPATGELVWHAADARSSYGTPVVMRVGETDIAVTPGGHCVRLTDGKLLAKRLAESKYTSPIADGNIVYFVDVPAVAVQLSPGPDGTIQAKTLWKNDDDLEGEFFASPLLEGGILYSVSNQGVLYALEAATGKVVYHKELEFRSAGGTAAGESANFYPSPTLVGRHLLVGNDQGEVLVLTCGRQYEEAGGNSLGQPSGASPAVAADRLYLRGGRKLYCIGK